MADLLKPVLQALVNDRRLQVLEWLADPRAHVAPQRNGDLVGLISQLCDSLIATCTQIAVANGSRGWAGPAPIRARCG